MCSEFGVQCPWCRRRRTEFDTRLGGDSGLTDGVEYTVFQNRTELSTRFFEKPCAQEGLGDGENIKTMYFSILISKLQKYMVLKISMYKTLGLEAEVYDSHLVQKP